MTSDTMSHFNCKFKSRQIINKIYLLQFSSSAQEYRQPHTPVHTYDIGTHDPSLQLNCPSGHAANGNVDNYQHFDIYFNPQNTQFSITASFIKAVQISESQKV